MPTICDPAERTDPIASVLCGPKGEPCLNGAKSYEKWYQGGFLGPNNAFPAVLAANETQILSLRASARDNMAGNLNLSQFIGNWTSSQLAVRLYSQWLDRWFSNVAIPVEILFGTPNWPALLMGSLYVKAGTGLTAETTDLSGAPNTVRLMGRGFQNLIQQGLEPKAAAQEAAYFHKFSRILPYCLGPDLGPQVPMAPLAALPNAATQQMTFTCPSDGDFYMVACYMLVFGAGVTLNNIAIMSWTEGNTQSFIDPVLLPIQADLVFSGSYPIAGMFADGRARAGANPGGWGGFPFEPLPAEGRAQWVHRLHRGTQMNLTVRNDNAGAVRVCPIFVGYLATCDAAPGEFLAFPQNQGQISRSFQQVSPGDPSCATCPPGVSMPGGRVIVAPQVQNGPPLYPPPPTPQMIAPPQGVQGMPPGRFIAPGRSQLYRGGQSW